MEKQLVIDGLKGLTERLMNEVSQAYRTHGYSFGNERFEKWKKCVCKFLDENLPGERSFFEQSLISYGMVSVSGETDE